VQVMNGLVSLGERTGKDRGRGPPLSYSDGVLESRRQGEEKRVSKRILTIPSEMVRKIRQERERECLSLLELSRRHGYSVRVIRRVLAKAD
jgi:hypothetical protein